MKRIAGAAVATLLAAALLTGCGGGDNNSSGPDQSGSVGTTSGGGATTTGGGATTTSSGGSSGVSGSYCDDLKTTKATVTAIGKGKLTQASFDEAAAALHAIAGEAPAGVADDWNSVADTIDAIAAALKKAGISFDDLDKIGQPGGPSIDPAAIAALTQALQGMDQTALNNAYQNINAEVTKDCGLDLGVGN